MHRAGDPAQQEAARLAAYAWATDATFGRSGCGAPKVMADVLESLTGAVYLDCARCAPPPGSRTVPVEQLPQSTQRLPVSGALLL